MRDFESPRYRRWRTAVYARDGFCCRLCGATCELNAHHIKAWARYPSLRFAVSNGITLCRIHHLSVKGREKEFEEALSRLVGGRQRDIAVLVILRRYD